MTATRSPGRWIHTGSGPTTVRERREVPEARPVLQGGLCHDCGSIIKVDVDLAVDPTCSTCSVLRLMGVGAPSVDPWGDPTFDAVRRRVSV